MDNKTRNETVKIVSQAVEEVVIPALDSLEEEIDGRFNKVEARLDRMEHKMDRILDEQLVTKNKVEDHEKRIKKLDLGRPMV